MAPPNTITIPYRGGELLVTPTGVIGEENSVDGVSRVVGVVAPAPTASYVSVDPTLAQHVIARPGLRLTPSSAAHHSLPSSIVFQDSEIQMCFSTDFERFPQNRALIVRQMRQQEGTAEHREGFQAFQYVAPRDPEIVRVALHQNASFSSGENHRFHQQVLRTLTISSSQNSPQVRAVVCQFARTCSNRELRRLAVAVGTGITPPPQRSLSVASVSARNIPSQPRPALLTTQDLSRVHLVVRRETEPEAREAVPGTPTRESGREVVEREVATDEDETRFPRGEDFFGVSPALHTAPVARYFVPLFPRASGEDRSFWGTTGTVRYPQGTLFPIFTSTSFPFTNSPSSPRNSAVVLNFANTPSNSGASTSPPSAILPFSSSTSTGNPLFHESGTAVSSLTLAASAAIADPQFTRPGDSETTPSHHPHPSHSIVYHHPTQVAANDTALVGDPAQTVFVGAPPTMYSPRTGVSVFARAVPANNNADGQVPGVSDGDGNPADHSGEEFAQSNQQGGQNPQGGNEDSNNPYESPEPDQLAAVG